MSAAKRKVVVVPVSGKTPEEWADMLVDNVSGATQLPTAAYAADYPNLPALQNEEDWRRNAVALFKLAIERTRAAELTDALEAITNEAGDTGRDLAWVRLHARAAIRLARSVP